MAGDACRRHGAVHREGCDGCTIARLRSTNAALLELLEDGVLSCIGHTYASCDVGGSVNADRGCWQCRARAAIERVESSRLERAGGGRGKHG